MKALPYPKLQKNRPDYETSLINCDITSNDSGVNIIIRGEFNLLDNELQRLIDEGSAGYCLIVRCNATNRSRIYMDGVESKFMLKLSKKDYADKVEIVPGIIAKEEITGYINDNLAEDYRESDVILPKNALIAECETFELLIYRYSEQSTESICRFRKGKIFSFNIDADYIEISVPEDTFNQYCRLTVRDCAQIFTSMFVVPVIQQIVQDFWVDRTEDAEQYSGYRWFVSLDEVIRNSLNLSKGLSAFEITSNILEDLLFESTDFLVKHYGGSEDVY